MEIIDLNRQDDILINKYSPRRINEIIGSKRQVDALVEWLKGFNKNAKIHKVVSNAGKKTRKRKTKNDNLEKKDFIIDNFGNDGNDSFDGIDGIGADKDEDKDSDNDDDDLGTKMKASGKKDPNACSCVIVTGDHGTGKTSMVMAILKTLNYSVKSVNFGRINNLKEIDDFVESLLLGNDIYGSLDRASNKVAILVDDIHTASTPTEKCVISSILKQNTERWICPVIFIGNNKHKKIMSLVKKDCYHIIVNPPTINDMISVLEKVGIGEGLKLEDEDVAYSIINHSQNDYRRLIITLGELRRLYGSREITKKDLDGYFKYIEEKDIDRSIYENTVKIFCQYKGINNTLKIFENDKTSMPLMVHQNHFMALSSYVKNKKIIYDLAADITEKLAFGDITDNYVYSDQNWSLQEIHGFYSCVYPSYRVSKNILTDKMEYDSKNPYYKPNFWPQYPKDLNRTSTRCINYKNVKLANSFFNNMTIDDYVVAIKIMKNLLEDGRIDEFKKILDTYNLTTQGIMYALKIDKINGTKKNISKITEKKIKDVSIEPIKSAVIKKKRNI